MRKDEFERSLTTAVGEPGPEAGHAGYALVIYQQDESRAVSLPPGARLVLGRVAAADIVLADSQLSRLHARIERSGDEVWVADLGSTNGTWVNGQRVARSRVRFGDQVRIGSLTIALFGAAQARSLPSHPRLTGSAGADPTLHNPLDPKCQTPAAGQPPVGPDLKSCVRRYEASLLADALERCGWNRTLAASQLQLPLRTLMYKLRDFALTPDHTAQLAAMLGPTDQLERATDFKSRVRRFERELLAHEMNRNGWNKAEGARCLGLPLSTLTYKLKVHGLTPPQDSRVGS